MTTIVQISSILTHNYILLITFLLFLTLISSSSLNKSHLVHGLTARLISPLSSESPYYTQILEANNISLHTISDHLPLNRTHYFEWIKQELSYPRLKINNIDLGNQKFSTITFRKMTGYLMNIYVGSPPQAVYGQFDTGSELVWFQCKENVTAVTKSSTFNQFKSSTYTIIPCNDDYMCDIHTSAGIRCGRKRCEFVTDYADDTHVEGVMGYDVSLPSLYNDTLAIADLMFGCTTSNAKKSTIGIIGAGNGKYAYPKQISQFDPKFSYCISNIVTKTYEIKFGKEAMLMGNSSHVFRNRNTPFYYLNVAGVKVDGKPVDVSPNEFDMSMDGSKGFIIDSGATLSYFSPKVFDAVQSALEELLGVPDKYWIYDICYPLSRFAKMRVRYKPIITIAFREFDLVLPTVGTWDYDARKELLCLLIRRTNDPLSTLGLVQLWDVNVAHDPEMNMLYLAKTSCPSF